MDETRNLPLVQDIILDMTESQLPVVYANQYDDSGRTVNCHMQDEGEDFDCSGYTIELWIKKSNDYALSETIVGENAIGSASGNIVSFPIKENMTYSHGRQECRLVFLSSDDKTSSRNFYIRVNKSNVDNEHVMDSNEYKTFHDEYLELKTQIDNIEVDNISSEAVKMADGTDLQTKMDNIEAEIDTKIDSVKIGTTECKSGTTVTLPVYTKDETDSTFGADIALTIDTSTYKMTLELKDNKGQVLSSKEIDFPIESMVVNASYSNGTLTLTLQNGNDINVDISSIISGLVPNTRTIAGVDLKDNITATELRTALNVENGAQVNTITGIKGNAESSYRTGNVNITASNIGLGNVNNTSDADKPISTATQTALNGKLATNGDSKSNTVTFTSSDVADGSATSWTSVTALASGITHATFLQRASQMFKNVRYLYKMLGTTDISSVGNGTVTGAISTLNSNLNNINKQAVIIGVINGIGQYVDLDLMTYREIVFRVNVSGAYLFYSFTPIALYNGNANFIVNFYESANSNLTLVIEPKSNRLTLVNMAITGWVLNNMEIVGVY